MSYSRPLATLSDSLLSSESQPDEVEGAAHTDQEADQGEVGGLKEMVCSPTNATPEEKSRYEISEDRPESVLFAAVTWFLAHVAMVDEFSTLDN